MSEVITGHQVVERSDNHCVKWSEETGLLVYLFEDQEYNIDVAACQHMRPWRYCIGTLKEPVGGTHTILFRATLVNGIWEPGKKFVLYPNLGSVLLEGPFPYICLAEDIKEIVI